MRLIDDKFMHNLREGELNPLLKAVQLDDTLSLEIRENYINVYYRGGNMLRVKQQLIKYIFEFDYNYCKHKSYPSKYVDLIIKNITVDDWVNAIPYIKAEMDLWFFEHPKLEREYQQVILRDNNNSPIARDTDYFISDIEYANTEHGCRFDLLGIKWLSETGARKKPLSPTLAIMELKYGDGAMTGNAGIQSHFSDINKFFSNPLTREAIFTDAQTMFNQKIELGLIQGTIKQIVLNKNVKPEFVLLFANHKPASTILLRELKQALLEFPKIIEYVDIKIATACALGYGLYADKIMDIEVFMSMHQEEAQ